LITKPAATAAVPVLCVAAVQVAEEDWTCVALFRFWQFTHRLIDQTELFLPPINLHTVATWVRVPPAAIQHAQDEGHRWQASLHAANHALVNILPLYIACSSSDVGCECGWTNPACARSPRLLLFDRHPGGVGVAPRARALFGTLLQAAIELVTCCPCKDASGCPGCLHNGECAEYNDTLDKQGGLAILRHTLAAEQRHAEEEERMACKDD